MNKKSILTMLFAGLVASGQLATAAAGHPEGRVPLKSALKKTSGRSAPSGYHQNSAGHWVSNISYSNDGGDARTQPEQMAYFVPVASPEVAQPAAPKKADNAPKPINNFAIMDWVVAQALKSPKSSYRSLCYVANMINKQRIAFGLTGIAFHNGLVRLADKKPAILDFMRQTPVLQPFVNSLKTTNGLFQFVNSIPSLVMSGIAHGPSMPSWSAGRYVRTAIALLIVGRLFEEVFLPTPETQALQKTLAREQHALAMTKQQGKEASRQAELKSKIAQTIAEKAHQEELNKQAQTQRAEAEKEYQVYIAGKQVQHLEAQQAINAESLRKEAERRKELADRVEQTTKASDAHNANEAMRSAHERLERQMRALEQTEQRLKAPVVAAPAVNDGGPAAVAPVAAAPVVAPAAKASLVKPIAYGVTLGVLLGLVVSPSDVADVARNAWQAKAHVIPFFQRAWNSVAGSLTTAGTNARTASQQKFENIKNAVSSARNSLAAKANNVRTASHAQWTSAKDAVTTRAYNVADQLLSQSLKMANGYASVV